MRRLTPTVLALFLAVPARAADAPPAAGYEEVARRLGALIERELADKRLPAVSIALVDDRKIVWARGFGFQGPKAKVPATADTVYRVGPLSEAFTFLAAAQFAERGGLDQDAPLTKYLPDFKPDNPSGKPITLRHLLAHRSGLVREPPVGGLFDAASPSLEKIAEGLNRTRLAYAPGSTDKESRADAALVGLVIERTQGRPFARHLARSLFEPLGMKRTSFEPDADLLQGLAQATLWTYHGHEFPAPRSGPGPAPAVGLHSTANDLAAFLVALFAGGPELRSFGLGLRHGELEGWPRAGRGGSLGGFSAALATLPGDKFGVVVLASRDGADVVLRRVADDALCLLLARKHGRPLPQLGPVDVPPLLSRGPSPLPDAPPARWLGLIGEYGPEHAPLTVLEKDGKLHVLAVRLSLYPLEEEGENVFRFRDDGPYRGETMVFTRDKAGRSVNVKVGGVELERRRLDGEDGRTYRLQPRRPLAEIRKEALAARPPPEGGELARPDLVDVAKLEPGIKLDIRYATDNNFLSTPFYTSARAFMQRPAAEALVRAHKALEKEGYGLLIHDAYRPWSVTKMFWEATPDHFRIFVADPAQGSRHNRGCAVDLTLYDRRTGKPVEMVGGYDEFSDRSYPDYVGGTSRQRWHRELLRRAMGEQGFTVYEAEWWHFDYKDWRKYPIGNLSFEEIAARPEK
jgi:D-alanyl-D-alanine dipeptidase/CubicO group peptidase (beta-lactamase class C family)